MRIKSFRTVREAEKELLYSRESHPPLLRVTSFGDILGGEVCGGS